MKFDQRGTCKSTDLAQRITPQSRANTEQNQKLYLRSDGVARRCQLFGSNCGFLRDCGELQVLGINLCVLYDVDSLNYVRENKTRLCWDAASAVWLLRQVECIWWIFTIVENTINWQFSQARTARGVESLVLKGQKGIVVLCVCNGSIDQ